MNRQLTSDDLHMVPQIIIVSLLLALPIFPAAAGEAPLVTVRFSVGVPPGTPGKESICIGGDAAALGSWRPDGLLLQRGDDGRHHGSIQVRAGTEIRFKVTRGTWETVEKGKDGEEIPNRTARIEKGCTVTVDVASFASGAARPPRKPTRTGDIREHREFPSRFLGRPRAVLVWLPPGYDAPERASERYPVLYLQDGQNLFDAATSAFGVEWQADETAARLIGEGRIRPVILVGIANTPARLSEYAPWPDPRLQPGAETQGETYGRFLAEELKPFIDRTYRTLPGREHTAVGGSSLGGLICLHLVQARRETFGLCAALSTSFQWADRRILEAYRKDPASLQGARIWADMGTAEGGSRPEDSKDPPPLIRDLRALGAALEAAGLKRGTDFRCEEIENGHHNEADWAKRFDRVLLFLFGK